MASVPNKVYPSAEFGEYRTNLVRTVAGTQSGSALVFKGAIEIQGFSAQGAITKYQPVRFTESGSIYVSGASIWGAGGLIGVAASTVADGAAVNVIIAGLVPYISSGATAITCGGPVMYAYSGSGGNTVVDFDSDTVTTGSYCVIGIAVATGSAAAAQTCQVWVKPGFY